MFARSAILVFSIIFAITFASAQTSQVQSSVASPKQLPAPTLSDDQVRAMIRRAAEEDIENQKAERNYTYIQREEEHKLDGKGQAKSTETRTYEIMVLFEEPVRKQIAKNDQPLPAKDAAKEEEKV